MKYYKTMLLKAYFEKGYALTSYIKWVLAIVGIGSAVQNFSLWYIAFGGFIYGISCFIIGWLWFKHGLVEAETEVGNQFNLFVKEMRQLSGSSVHRKI